MLHSVRSASLAAILAVSMLGLVACQQPAQNGQQTVYITGDSGGHSFNPGNVSVQVGTIVTWINQDTKPHTVTDVGVFDSGPIPPNGGRWSWGASAVGSYTYHCLIDPDMNGTIVVTTPTVVGY